MQEAKKALVAQLQALAEEPRMVFALEQPHHSALWDLPEVTTIIEEQATWTKHEVDPSIAMANYHWQPMGPAGTWQYRRANSGTEG